MQRGLSLSEVYLASGGTVTMCPGPSRITIAECRRFGVGCFAGHMTSARRRFVFRTAADEVGQLETSVLTRSQTRHSDGLVVVARHTAIRE